MTRNSRPSAASISVLECRAPDVNRGDCAGRVDSPCKTQAWPRRVRLLSDRKIHDLIVRDWADVLDLAHMSHAAIFRDNKGALILAEMDWEAKFWGHA